MMYDLIIIGLGALGSATLYQASKFSKNILGIDQFHPPHKKGSSHGESRIIKIANHEGSKYTTLALKSMELWRDLAKKSPSRFKQFFIETGGVILAPLASTQYSKTSPPNFPPTLFDKIREMAFKHQVKHQILNHQALLNRFGQSLNFNEEMIGYFENSINCLRPELCIEIQLDLAKKNNAEIKMNERVLKYSLLPNGIIHVITNQGSYKTAQLLISAGAWVNDLITLKETNLFKVYRQISFWFRVSDQWLDCYKPQNFPIVIMDSPNGTFACFPVLNNNSMKILTLIEEEPTSPDQVSKEIPTLYKNKIYNSFIKSFLPGLTSNCIRAESCLYTQTDSGNFIIDYLPGFNKKIIFASACSGHGFKHSIAIGESLANIIFNQISELNVIDFFGV